MLYIFLRIEESLLSMCFGDGPKWKREVVKDHKFDYIDINEFYDPSCGAKSSYMFMYILMFKSFAVYIADLWTAVSLIVIGNSSINADASIPPDVAKWIFLGAIIISFGILFWEIKKSRGIIDSRDISLAFFSQIANRYYSIRDYSCFCLFRAINNSRKRWKKILLAEAPRQVINIVTLIAIIPKWIQINHGLEVSYEGLGKTYIQRIMTGTMIFSTFMFGISFISFCAAVIIYFPVLCHIRGNLKEYCCHKVDKRINEILKKQARERVERNTQSEKRGHKHHHHKKDDIEMRSFPQPTLPKMDPQTLAPGPYYHHRQHSNTSLTTGSQYSYGPRRNSLTSVYSEQAGLTSHAQGQPYSSPYQSQTNLSHYAPQPRGHYSPQPRGHYSPQPQAHYSPQPQYQSPYNQHNHY
ncbi:uncharacterized protein B0P05DRAFT_592108 [Gilbertella persicaria]|uniref:uncharacterized protein n=1 Tax=Gilbertella persicaria TaxID=101096 RepID=UPI00221FFBE8|nr:uncharacterized protein B0P05DRAFT_592108 [Gilbertella persicaria]KAI8049421.1 hypothetical protein B0P05DRAFT_592108 [Gilbertella persicaria]